PRERQIRIQLRILSLNPRVKLCRQLPRRNLLRRQRLLAPVNRPIRRHSQFFFVGAQYAAPPPPRWVVPEQPPPIHPLTLPHSFRSSKSLISVPRCLRGPLTSQSLSAPENTPPPHPAHASTRPPPPQTAQSNPPAAWHPPFGRRSTPAPSAQRLPYPVRSTSRCIPKSHQSARDTSPAPPRSSRD